MPDTVLVVEDDSRLRGFICDNLHFEGYATLQAEDGEQGLDCAVVKQPDILILDVGIPRRDGIDVCQRLRKLGHALPIILLTARVEEAHKIQGLNAGADDYVTKPFSINELIARVKSQLRRSDMQRYAEPSFNIGESRVRLDAHCIERGSQRTRLSDSETQILRMLAQTKGTVVSREDFINSIGDGRRFSNTRALDNCIASLRRKLQSADAASSIIESIHGVGYRLL